MFTRLKTILDRLPFAGISGISAVYGISLSKNRRFACKQLTP